MPTISPYDEIADWYEREFLATQRSAPTGSRFADTLGIDEALVELLGTGDGACLEVGCGTGIYAERVEQLGWRPFGVDISAGMLRHARDRLAVSQADAQQLPFPDGAFDAVIAIMVHTDMPSYPPVLREVHRVLRPGGRFVHIGVHPCFCGGFADRSQLDAIVIRPGYRDGRWTTESWTDRGIRDKVGAWHLSLSELVNGILATGFRLDEVTEGGSPTPIVLSVSSTKPG